MNDKMKEAFDAWTDAAVHRVTAADEEALDKYGRENFFRLKESDPALHAAIGSFSLTAYYDPPFNSKGEYCLETADWLDNHLRAKGYADFRRHAHGHCFVADKKLIIDVWKGMDPKVWRVDDPRLRGSCYSPEAGLVGDCPYCTWPEYAWGSAKETP